MPYLPAFKLFKNVINHTGLRCTQGRIDCIMEGVDVITVLDRDERDKWSVFGALACVWAI